MCRGQGSRYLEIIAQGTQFGFIHFQPLGVQSMATHHFNRLHSNALHRETAPQVSASKPDPPSGHLHFPTTTSWLLIALGIPAVVV
jgi:hypothetical protein